MEAVVVFDLATLRFAWGNERRTLSVSSSRGEVLATVPVPAGTEPRWAAFSAMDAALEHGRVVREDADGDLVTARVAFYNPLSLEIALDAVPLTRVFGNGEPVLLDRTGTLSWLDDDTLGVGGRLLAETSVDMAAIARAAGAHPVPR